MQSHFEWGTANGFPHPRYGTGAAIGPDPVLISWAAAQAVGAMNATHRSCYAEILSATPALVLLRGDGLPGQ
jgi:xylose isomerase